MFGPPKTTTQQKLRDWRFWQIKHVTRKAKLGFLKDKARFRHAQLLPVWQGHYETQTRSPDVEVAAVTPQPCCFLLCFQTSCFDFPSRCKVVACGCCQLAAWAGSMPTTALCVNQSSPAPPVNKQDSVSTKGSCRGGSHPTAAPKTRASSCWCSKINVGTVNKNSLVLYGKGLTLWIYFLR